MSKTVALVGAPNSGKTTLYNWLTNSRFKTVNYPGATVEYSVGALAPRWGADLQIMDTPGTYSLFAKSADEEVTVKVLYGSTVHQVEKVIVVCDGTQLERHLILAKQLKESGFSIVIAVTMADLFQKSGIQFNKDILAQKMGCPVVLVDGLLGAGVADLVKAVQKISVGSAKPISAWSESKIASVTKEVLGILSEALSNPKAMEKVTEKTHRIDRVLLHPVFGVFIFFAIMALLFSTIFWAAAPAMDAVDAAFSWVADQVVAFAPDALWTDFIAHGIVGSFAAVFVFVPQIFILFLGVGFLESSGYLARAATLIDKPFSRLGLSGRAFVPVLSGFACAVPAMMATRNISSPRERFIANMIIPLMTCSARLPVYALLLSFLFVDQPAWKAGVWLAVLYFLALVVGSIASVILNRLIKKSSTSFFVMELPIYRKPRWKVLLQQSLSRTKGYATRAGPMIFSFAVLLWVGTTFPSYQESNPQVKLEQSYLGGAGQFIEPLFKPMGADWRVGVSLLSAFAAREVFVSSMAVVFNITDTDEDSQTQSLLTAMREAKFADGTPLFTTSSVAALIVFFMIALQCMSTFATTVKETGSTKTALGQLAIFNLVAYILAVVVFHVF